MGEPSAPFGRRTLSPRRLHRDEHEPPGRARRCFLQQAEAHFHNLSVGEMAMKLITAAVKADLFEVQP